MNFFPAYSVFLTLIAYFAGVRGIRRGKPMTALLILGMWFQGVIAPLILNTNSISPMSYNEKVPLVFLFGVILFLSSSWYANWLFPEFGSFKILSKEFLAQKKYKIMAFLFTFCAWVGFICKIILLGGVNVLWTRSSYVQVKGAGFLELLLSYILLYPIVLLQLYIGSDRNIGQKIPKLLILIPLLFLAFSFCLGTTTIAILDLSALSYPLLMTMRNKTRKFITLRLITFGLIAFLCVGFLRFGRFIGEAVILNGQSIDSAIGNIEGSPLALNNSFTEYQVFAGVVHGVDNGGPTLGLRSYELSVLQFIPGFIWTDKQEFINESRPDYFYQNNYAGGFAPLPSTFLGEGYLSGGIIGLIIESLIFGFVVGLLERMLMKCSMMSLGTTVGALLTPFVIIQVRMDLPTGSLFLIAALLWGIAIKLSFNNKRELKAVNNVHNRLMNNA